jgi:hypothetical protein
LTNSDSMIDQCVDKDSSGVSCTIRKKASDFRCEKR